MICPKCQYVNPDDANFCSKCGSNLIGIEIREEKKIENFPEKRQVTVMFCDLVGSTELLETLDPEAYADYISNFQQLCKNSIIPFHGHLQHFLGDGIVAFFGYPKAYEESAALAIRSGLDNQKIAELGKSQCYPSRPLRIII
jgi:class 3 adenylate cyclase